MRGCRALECYRPLWPFSGLLITLMLLPGCAPPPTAAVATGQPMTTIRNIKINNVNYSTTTAALEAQRQIIEKTLDELTKDPDPIKGRARVIVPDRDRLRPLVAQLLLQQTRRQFAGQALEFYVDERRQEAREFADAIARSNAFEAVTVIEQNDVLNPDIGDADYLVWYQVRTTLPNNTGPWLAHWLVRRAGSPATGSASVDPGTAPGAPRLASLVKSVHAAALRLGGVTVAGATAASQPPGAPAVGAGAVASGFNIDKHGHIVTNEHVIRLCSDIRVTDAANQTYSASIIAKDAANDLALLQTAHHWPDAATFRDGREPRPGDAVVAAGYPLNGLLGSSMAVTTGSLTALAGPRDDSRLLQLSAPIQLGNSGGPLLDSGGHVIGVVTGTLNGMILAVLTGVVPQNVNFALKASIIRNFLDTQGIGYEHAAGVHELSPADVGEIARKFTLRVACGKR